MSNINDNNLDDLLRRAAEKYPLRTDSADWGRLVSDLEKDPSLILPPVGEDRRRRRRFFWLFLLLPLAGVGYYAWHGSGRAASLAEQTSVVAGKDGQAPASAGGGHVGEKGQTNAQADQGGHVGGEKGEQNGQANVPGQGDQTGVPAEKDGHVQVGGKTGQTGVPGPSGQTGMRALKNRETAGQSGRNSRIKSDNVPGDNVTGDNIIGDNINDIKDENASGGNLKSGQDERGLHLASNNMQRVNTKMRGDVAAGNIPVKSNAKKDIKLQKSKPSFYVGILGSPDLSTIKWQSVKNVGTRFGLLLGYSFNSRWSIESGAYYSRKNYYTDGEYFDKTNAYILKYVDQLKVNGVCNMWEFPVNVRYNLSTGGKMKWFATAGVSAYYMSKEKYDCSGYLNGAPWSEEWNKKPSHNSWSSNLNLSVGYEQRLGRIGNLRLEPYVRVPMTGIGTGKLSIMSAGLNIGITRRIW